VKQNTTPRKWQQNDHASCWQSKGVSTPLHHDQNGRQALFFTYHWRHCQVALAVAVVSLGIDAVSVSTGPIHVASAAVLTTAVAIVDEPGQSVVTLKANGVSRADAPLLGIVHRHGIAGRVEASTLVKSSLAKRRVL